jgi:tRNA modification GTPase
VAASSAPGVAARAVVRLSGPLVPDLARDLFVPSEGHPWAWERRAARGSLHSALAPPELPVALWAFPAPRSATGEDVAEFHLPGNPLLVRRLLDALEARGARPARPGEFTRRAVLSGRQDLLAAGAVMALVASRDAQELRRVRGLLEEGLSSRLRAAAAAVDDLLVPLELSLDFSDQDVEIELPGPAALAAARALLQDLAVRAAALALPRSRPLVVLRGPPNAGKSSLFNRLLGTGKALVSPEAGTTRDVLFAQVRCEGLEFLIADTAGTGHVRGPADREADARRKAVEAGAGLLLSVQDGRIARAELDPPGALPVRTHADLVPESMRGPGLWVSSTTGLGIVELIRAIAARQGGEGGAGAALAGQAAAFEAAALDLQRAEAALARGDAPELAASDLRRARQGLAILTGEDVTEEILDRIFREFCIGK